MPQADRGPPKRAPYGSHTAPVPAAKYSCWPRAATHRPACRAAAKSPAKHPTGCTPSQNTRPRPYGRGARFPFVRFVPSSSMSRSAQSQRQAPHDRQNNSARPSARHIAAQSPVSHTPRHAAPPAAPRKTLGPAAMPGAPSRPATKIVLLVAHRTPRTIAPPAAPPQKIRPAAPKFGSTARPRHAAGRPRAAKARAVWQPHRARPRRKILLLAARRDPSPRLPRRREKSGQTPDRMHPVPKHAPPAHTGGGAFPFVRFVPSSENGRSAQSQRQAPHDRQNNSARPSARHIAAQSPVSHTPRHAAPPAAPQKTLGPVAMPGAPPRPATKIVLLVARRTPRPHRPARHISAHNPANRTKIGQHPTGRTAPAPP